MERVKNCSNSMSWWYISSKLSLICCQIGTKYVFVFDWRQREVRR